MVEVMFEGGMTATRKCVKWKLNNFGSIFKHESLVKRQKLEFDVTDSSDVTSTWKASLDFKGDEREGTPNNTANAQMLLELGVTLESLSSGYSSVIASMCVEIPGRNGGSVFNGSCSPNPDYNCGRRIAWKLTPFRKNQNIDYLLMHDGAMVIKLDVVIFGSLIESFSEEYLETKLVSDMKNEVHRAISSLENDQANSDVKIISKDGREYFAYRWILRGASDVFEAMFRLDMREKDTGVVKFEDLSGNAVKVLLHYVYTGKMAEEWKNPGTVEEVVYAADKYQLGKMKNFINKRLAKLCTVENAFGLLTLAEQMGLKEAEVDILKFIKEKIRDRESLMEIFSNVSSHDDGICSVASDKPNLNPTPITEQSDGLDVQQESNVGDSSTKNFSGSGSTKKEPATARGPSAKRPREN